MTTLSPGTLRDASSDLDLPMTAARRIDIDSEREERELRAYLGDGFDYDLIRNYQAQLEEELDRIGDEQTLYRTSEAYLYDLTVFAMSRTKVRYLRDMTRFVRPGARVLDYGCGIGSDGLCLLEAGYDVAFADFDNPSTRYLQWRLGRRGYSAAVYDLDQGAPPAGFDIVFAFDVIEHVDDPFDFLGRLETQAELVMVNFLESEPGETALHRELPVRDLIRHAAERRLLRYRRYHGRSHLVLYGSDPARWLSRARSRAALWRGRLS